MKKGLFIIFAAFAMVFAACSHKQQEEKVSVIDTIPVLVTQIQKCNRLYTAEAHVHKIITHDDQLNLQGSLFKQKFSFHVPGSNRKIAIPMDATIKTYIDFKDFSIKNVKRQGEKIEITLPDPKMVLTSSKIDHKAVKQYISFTRSNFSDAELAQLEQQGRQSIIKDIPQLNLIEQAQLNAANIIIPMLKDMGFKEENIKINFRKKFTLADIQLLFDGTTIEKKTSSSK